MSRKVLASFFIMLFSKMLLGNSQDSVPAGFVAKMDRFFKESAKKSIQDLELDRAAIRQNRVLWDKPIVFSGYTAVHSVKVTSLTVVVE